MRLLWRHDGTPEGSALPADAPEKPDSSFILWAGILAAAGGSVFFNVYHDTHSLPSELVGVIAGILPPFMAATIIHAVKVTREKWVKVCVFIVTAGAMVVSAVGASEVLQAAYHSWGSYLFMLVLDSADLLLLYAIMEHYEKVRAYRKWVKASLAAQAAAALEATAGAGTGSPGHAAPAPGTSPAAPAPRHRGTGQPVPAAKRLVPPRPVPGGAPAGATGESGVRDGQPPAAAFRARTADPELCKRVVAEFAAAHPRPAVEDVDQLRARAVKFLDGFRDQTGERANNAELGRALHIHPKRQVPKLRAAISEPDEEQAGEEKTG